MWRFSRRCWKPHPLSWRTLKGIHLRSRAGRLQTFLRNVTEHVASHTQSPSSCLPYATIFFCIFFFSLPFPFLLISFFPTEPCINTSLHTFILHSLPPSQCSIPRLAFIFLSRSRKSKEDCIYKREHKSKNITIPVRMTAHFASLCALFFFFFFLFQLSVDSFCAIEISRRRSARRGKKEGPKVCKKKKNIRSHSRRLFISLPLSSPRLVCIALKSPTMELRRVNLQKRAW